MGRWCAGPRACRRWRPCQLWSGRRWRVRRRARGSRWCSSRPAPRRGPVGGGSEPPGRACVRAALFSPRRGHAVFRVSSAKAADLRRFLRRHAKSNGIDAETLARLPLADPRGLQPLELPGADAAALDRRVRACARLTRAASEHKVRIKDLVRQLLPMTPLTGDLGKADLAILEQHADPRELLAAGEAGLTRLITTVPAISWGAREPGSGWPPRWQRWNSTVITRRCPSASWLPMWPPRCGC